MPSMFEGPDAVEATPTVEEEEYNPELEAGLLSGTVSKKAIEDISKKYGLSTEELIAHAYLRGGTVEGETRPILYFSTLAGEALPISGGAVAAFTQKKAAPVEKRAAFDEVANIVEEKRSATRVLGEVAIGIASPIDPVSKLGPAGPIMKLAARAATSKAGQRGMAALVHGATVGGLSAAAGVASSKEGEELSSALVGGAFGGVLGAGLGAIKKPGAAIAEEGKLTGGFDVPDARGMQVVEEAVLKNKETDDLLKGVIDRLEFPENTVLNYKKRMAEGVAEYTPGEVTESRKILTKVIKDMDDEELSLVANATENLVPPSTKQKIFEDAQEFFPNPEQAAEMNRYMLEKMSFAGIRKELISFGRHAMEGRASKKGSGNIAEALNRIAVLKGEGEGLFAERWAGHTGMKAAKDPSVQEVALQAGVKKEGNAIASWFDRKLNPSRYVAANSDRINGTSTLPILDSLSSSLNKAKTAMSSLQTVPLKTIKQLDEIVKRTGEEYNSITDAIYQKIDATSPLTETDKRVLALVPEEVIRDIEDGWELFRRTANDLAGEEVVRKFVGEGGGSYIQHAAVDFPEAVRRILAETKEVFSLPKMQEILPSTNTADVEKLLGKGSEELERYNKLKDALEWMTNSKFNTVEGVQGGLDSLVHNRGRELGEYQARAMQTRIGENIPPLIGERDVVKLQERYLIQTMKMAAIQKDLISLRNQARIVGKIGDKETEKYFLNLIHDLTMGTRMGTMGRALSDFNKVNQINLLRRASNSQSAVGKKMWETAAAYPEIVQFMMNQMYPSVLSVLVNPVSALVNLTQPFFYTVPEIGRSYGSKLALKAAFDISKELGDAAIKRAVPASIFEMSARGFLGAQWSAELAQALEEATAGMRGTFAKSMGRGLGDLNSLFMKPFELAEINNRTMVFNMGKRLGNDLIEAIQKGGKGLTGDEQAALKYFKEIPDAYKRQIVPLIRNLQGKEVPISVRNSIQDKVIGHLLAKTIFNYDKVSANALARELAPALMTFTKFPLNVVGDIVDSLRRKGGSEGIRDVSKRFLGPHVTLMLADQIMQSLSEEERIRLDEALSFEDPLASTRFLLTGGSKSGLKRYSILGSTTGLLTGQWASPPVLSPIASAVGFLSGDGKMAKKELQETAKFFLPAPVTNMFSLYDTLAAGGVLPEPFWWSEEEERRRKK